MVNFSIALMVALLASCTAEKQGIERPSESLGNLKGALFQSLLRADAAEIPADTIKERMVRRNEARIHSMADELEKQKLDTSRLILPKNIKPKSRAAELDMFWNAQTLTKSEKKQITAAYHRFSAELRHIREAQIILQDRLLREPTSQKIKGNLAKLYTEEVNSMIASVESLAKLIREADIDRDYAYRAILREHRRRLGP